MLFMIIMLLKMCYLEQLREIRKSSMSRLICDNARDIDEMQPLAFVLAGERLVNSLNIKYYLNTLPIKI